MIRSFLLVSLLPTLLLWSACAREVDSRQFPARTQIQTKSRDTPRFTTIRVLPRKERIEIFLRDNAGQPFKRLDRLASWLTNYNKHLRFAMNAGMFEPDLSPVGLLVQNGRQVSPLNLTDGSGNFFLKPNGVFLIADSKPRIVASTEYPALAHGVRLATQSGPLLIHDGRLHPSISPTSTSRLIRNGVGVSGDTVTFVISEQPVTFYELATFFRDELHCADALYLDGVVSGLYSPQLRRNDSRVDLGPMIGVVE